MSVMRYCVGLISAMVLLAGCVFGQASTSTLTATQATPVSRPIEVKAIEVNAIDVKAIDLRPDATGVVPPEQIRDLLRRAEEKDLENEKRLRDYTYIEREERHKLNGRGGEPDGVKKIDSRTWEILEIYGEPVARLTAKDDKTLSAGEAKKEDDKIQKIIDKRKNESEEDRRKRLEKEEKRREEDRDRKSTRLKSSHRC